MLIGETFTNIFQLFFTNIIYEKISARID